MKRNPFAQDGIVTRALEHLADMIILSALWVVSCLPVVTIVPATAALYYATVKSVRRGVGKPSREFWQSFKTNLWRGIGATVLLGAVGAVLVLDFMVLKQKPNTVMGSGCLVLLAVAAMVAVYVGPVLSRFSLKLGKIFMLSFVMAVRFLPITVVLVAGTAAVALVQFYVLPLPMILLLPGLWCWVSSFLTERALRCYMPKREEGQEPAWYDDDFDKED